MDLSIISVTHNNEQVLPEFLDSLKPYLTENKGNKIEAVIVDNASSDDSMKLLKSEKDLHVIQTDINLGFSKANNVGIIKATGRYLLFLNSDTKFSKEVFPYLITQMDANPKFGAMTCRVLLPDGTDDLNTLRNFPTPRAALCHFLGLNKLFPNNRFFNGYFLTSLDPTKVHSIPACGGSFLLTRREIIEKLGGWDEDYFLYGEDLDLCFRIKKLGYEIIYDPHVSITHYGGVSTGIKKSGEHLSSASKEKRREMADHSVDAMGIFYKKNLAPHNPFYINGLVKLGMISLRILRKISFSA